MCEGVVEPVRRCSIRALRNAPLFVVEWRRRCNKNSYTAMVSNIQFTRSILLGCAVHNQATVQAPSPSPPPVGHTHGSSSSRWSEGMTPNSGLSQMSTSGRRHYLR